MGWNQQIKCSVFLPRRHCSMMRTASQGHPAQQSGCCPAGSCGQRSAQGGITVLSQLPCLSALCPSLLPPWDCNTSSPNTVSANSLFALSSREPGLRLEGVPSDHQFQYLNMQWADCSNRHEHWRTLAVRTPSPSPLRFNSMTSNSTL